MSRDQSSRRTLIEKSIPATQLPRGIAPTYTRNYYIPSRAGERHKADEYADGVERLNAAWINLGLSLWLINLCVDTRRHLVSPYLDAPCKAACNDYAVHSREEITRTRSNNV